MGSFSTKARTVELLGRKQIRDSVTAIAELMKNSYDADAPTLRVEFNTLSQSHRVVIADSGIGMNKDKIENNWLVLGTNSKTHRRIRKTDSGRPLMGAKGIGRLAAAAVGRQLWMFTKTLDSKWNIVYIHWGLFENPRLAIHEIAVPTRFDIPSDELLLRFDDIISDMKKELLANFEKNAWKIPADSKGIPAESSDDIGMAHDNEENEQRFRNHGAHAHHHRAGEAQAIGKQADNKQECNKGKRHDQEGLLTGKAHTGRNRSDLGHSLGRSTLQLPLYHTDIFHAASVGQENDQAVRSYPGIQCTAVHRLLKCPYSVLPAAEHCRTITVKTGYPNRTVVRPQVCDPEPHQFETSKGHRFILFVQHTQFPTKRGLFVLRIVLSDEVHVLFKGNMADRTDLSRRAPQFLINRGSVSILIQGENSGFEKRIIQHVAGAVLCWRRGKFQCIGVGQRIVDAIYCTTDDQQKHHSADQQFFHRNSPPLLWSFFLI